MIVRGGQWAADLQAQLPRGSLSQWMASDCRIVKRDSHSLVALAELQQQLCYLKLYRPKSPLQRLAFRLGHGRAVAAFDHALLLSARDIAVPTPLACLRVDDGLLLVTEGLAGASDLKSYWQASDSLLPLLPAAAESLALLHRTGFAHGDCKWSNLLWHDHRIYLVDLEAVTACAPASAAQWRDLARFTVNAEDMGLPKADYDNFLSPYCRHMGIERELVLASMQAPLTRLRRRHESKYGERGARLV